MNFAKATAIICSFLAFLTFSAVGAGLWVAREIQRDMRVRRIAAQQPLPPPQEPEAVAETAPQESAAPPEAVADKTDAPVVEEEIVLKGYLGAEQPPEPPPASDSAEGVSNLIPKRVTVSHVEGTKDAFEYGSNDTTLAFMFAPNYRRNTILPFVDIRGHRFDNNLYAANFGIGARYLSDATMCEVLGFNAYYDYRQGNLGQFNQIGFGAEMLGRYLEFRVNAYVPVGRQKIKQECQYNYAGGYTVNRIQCELVSYGFNGEIGAYVYQDDYFFLYPAVGIYYYTGNCIQHTKRGVEARLRPQYKDIVALDLSVRHDSVFNTVYQAALIFYLPLYQLNAKRIDTPQCHITRRQMYQPVERFDTIPLAECDCWQTNY